MNLLERIWDEGDREPMVLEAQMRPWKTVPSHRRVCTARGADWPDGEFPSGGGHRLCRVHVLDALLTGFLSETALSKTGLRRPVEAHSSIGMAALKQIDRLSNGLSGRLVSNANCLISPRRRPSRYSVGGRFQFQYLPTVPDV
jgi:hypothetical protein